MTRPEKISVIVTTYNRPVALERVLQTLFDQSVLPDEIIVADDGSTDETSDLLEQLKATAPCALIHVWQPDDGFRAAAIRNRAVARSTGNYLIFLDGDCLLLPDFIRRHQHLAKESRFVVGNRLMVNKMLTHKIENQSEDILQWKNKEWLIARLMGEINRITPLLNIPGKWWRELRGKKWQGAKTCNLGVWKEDFLSINGLDESYQGWGHEDADMVVRLIKKGVRRIDGHYGLPVIHLWHKESDRKSEEKNRSRLEQAIYSDSYPIRAAEGIDKHLDDTRNNS